MKFVIALRELVGEAEEMRMADPHRRCGLPGGHDVGLFGLADGVAVITGSVLAAGVLFPAGQVSARLILVAVAVGVCAAVLPDGRMTLVVAGLGFVLFTGFLTNSYGGFRWDGVNTVWHLFVFAMATAIGLAQRWIRAAQGDLEFDIAMRNRLGEADGGENGWSSLR
ncbi:hypothetical protein WEI85_27395 [Actinomycetes bacterium KLBMP 9797]